MRILFVGAEVAPFVSVGGLSQVMLFLPKALNKLGHDTRIFTAKYGSMDETGPNKRKWKLEMDTEGLIVSGSHNNAHKDRDLICNVKVYEPKNEYPKTYFLENQEYFELRANVFGYKDDHIRFELLSKGVLEWVYKQWQKKKKEGRDSKVWVPEIIHCNDWHTGYVTNLAKTVPKYRKMLAHVPLVFTVHNFSYQGNYDFKYQDPKKRDNGRSPLAGLFSENLQAQNPLLRGMLYADAVNTVSPTHATEVLTAEYAQGLDETLYQIRGKLTGILNGLDTEEFNPATDPIISHNFSAASFTRQRAENKEEIQKLFLLPVNPEVPLLGSVGRICTQKGWDFLIEILPTLLDYYKNLQFIAVGGGDDKFRQELLKIQQDFPKQIGLHLRPDFRLPRKIFAGVDMMVIPSTFEPGGIVAMESLRYGAVPIIRRTGGLNDIVEDFDPGTAMGNGFSFTSKRAWELFAAIIRAITIFEQPKLWDKLVKNCLKANYSWERSAKEYSKWYKKLTIEKKRASKAAPHPAYAPTVELT